MLRLYVALQVRLKAVDSFLHRFVYWSQFVMRRRSVDSADHGAKGDVNVVKTYVVLSVGKSKFTTVPSKVVKSH